MFTDADISQNHHQEHHNGEDALEDIDALRLYFLIFKTERTARNANIIIMDSKRMYLDCARNAVSRKHKRDYYTTEKIDVIARKNIIDYNIF